MVFVQLSNEKVIQAIFSAVDEINQQLPRDERLEKSMETVLFDRGGPLDSLGLVTLIVAAEQKIEEQFGTVILLADEKVMSRASNPFRTIGALVNHVSMLLGRKLNGQAEI